MKLFLKSSIHTQKGFSLIEILIALTLIGIAGTFVAGKIFEQLEEGQIQAARIQMGNLEARLKDFKRKCYFYPSTEQGLEALVQKPAGGKECKNYPPDGFIDGGEVPNDPWDEPYVYKLEGRNFDIISAGPDQELETDDDISHRNKKGNNDDAQ
jgi:general secretion pathway protein G